MPPSPVSTCKWTSCNPHHPRFLHPKGGGVVAIGVKSVHGVMQCFNGNDSLQDMLPEVRRLTERRMRRPKVFESKLKNEESRFKPRAPGVQSPDPARGWWA